MSSEINTPIELDFKSAQLDGGDGPQSIRTFTSYSFDKNILVPASPFRFTAPGVDKDKRLAIRSSDLVELFVVSLDGVKNQISTGIIDQTDTHIIPNSVDYVLTGRDMMGQLVDNAAVDANNRIVYTKQIRIDDILKYLVKNTRVPQGILTQQIPNGQFLFQTNPGETRINALQRYLEFANCLIWCAPNGQLILGKPNFTNSISGKLIMSSTDPVNNNCVEARVQRNTNTAIRQIVTQVQSASQVGAAPFTVNNSDADMSQVVDALAGRSVFRLFNYGDGNESVNQIVGVGNGNGSPYELGNALSLREIARENMKILDIEVVIEGHANEFGQAYNIDQMYNVQIDDENVQEDMYVYACKYDLTEQHGRLTTLKLCRQGTIVAYADALRRAVS